MILTKRYLAIANIAAFGLILTIILFLNLNVSSGSKSFAWNAIRYTTSTTTLITSRGTCPGLARTKKPALVVARVAADGDSTWLDDLSKKYHVCVYNADAPLNELSNELQIPANRGHEAMVYLTFIIDNYHTLPKAGAVFVHGKRFAWHNDSPEYDNHALIAKLDIARALEHNGYHNLRCDWSASTCHPADAPPQGSLETIFKAKISPWDSRAVSDAAIPESLAALFGDTTVSKVEVKLGRSDALRSQCCAQFVVASERIQAHTREEYIAIRQWLLDGSAGQPRTSTAAPSNDLIAGRVLSYLWHILFIRNSDGLVNLQTLNEQACPNASECYCRLYGRCNLQHCSRGRCQGQYSIPRGYDVPKDWEQTHPLVSVQD